MNNDRVRKLLEQDLMSIDLDLRKSGDQLTIVLIGGASIVLAYNSSIKTTEDIDVLESRPVRILERHGISMYPDHYLNLLEDYHERIIDVPFIGMTNLTVKSLGTIDVVISKIGAGRSKDIADCKQMAQEGILIEAIFRPYFNRWLERFEDKKPLENLYNIIFHE
ncbi:MAG TPA: DUF6036 family nucleotidyltransferase [Bacilli bacterium]